MFAMLLLLAAPSQPGVQAMGTASVLIRPGVRVGLADQTARGAAGEPQRNLHIRSEDGRARPWRLIEFQ